METATRFTLPKWGRAGSGCRIAAHTLMHISYEHEVDAFLDGTRGMLLERIMGETGLQWDGGAFCLETSPRSAARSHLFLWTGADQGLRPDVAVPFRTVGSTFYDDLTDLLFSMVDEAKIERDFQPQVPNAEVYPVDFRIEGKGDVPLFLYGVPNRDKARLTTIMLSHFHRHELRFESILVFEDQADIPRMDLARLSDVGGDMISSLASREDFNRKVLQRVAA